MVLNLAKKTLAKPHTNCIFDALELLMKHIFLFLGLLMCSISGYAQTKNISISWENDISKPSFVAPTSTFVKSKTVKKSSKQMASERLMLTLTKEAIDFSEQWKDTGFANPSTLKVSNIKYGDISSKELAQVSVSDIPTTLQTNISSKKARDEI